MDSISDQPTRHGGSIWQLVGHDWAVDMLREHLVSDGARHAYLFTGPAGVGRRTLALRFIQAMNCPTPSGPGTPCFQDTCRVCRQIHAMQHADLKVVQVPEGKSELPIDLVRELQAFLMLAPYESPYKVGLLLNFEKATIQAQNALLKTLEEAPPRARLLLTAEAAESLLPTIVSRCEPIRLRPLPTGLTAKELTARFNLSTEKAELIDHLSGGRFGYAIRLAGDDGYLERRVELLDALLPLFGASIRDRFRLVEEQLPRKFDANRQRQAAREVILTWQSMFRDILLRSAGALTPLVNVDYASRVDTLATRISVNQAEHLITACDRALSRVDGYCNVRLTLESLVLEI